MSTLTQFLPQTGIKSIQRGVTGSVAATGTESITISSVDTNKSILTNLGTTATNTATYFTAQGYFELTSSTNINFQNGSSGNSVKGAWQLVEYY